MVLFREMKEEDLNTIFYNKSLRPLVTIDTNGERLFAMLIEREKKIVGGVSGSVSGKNAFVKCNVLANNVQQSLYKDGLYRALINKLEIEGVEYLFVFEYDSILKSLGFRQFKVQNPENTRETAIKEFNADNNFVYWINTKEFFD